MKYGCEEDELSFLDITVRQSRRTVISIMIFYSVYNHSVYSRVNYIGIRHLSYSRLSGTML